MILKCGWNASLGSQNFEFAHPRVGWQISSDCEAPKLVLQILTRPILNIIRNVSLENFLTKLLCGGGSRVDLGFYCWHLPFQGLSPNLTSNIKWFKMTVNYSMMVERYPNLKEEVGGSIPDYEVLSQLDRSLPDGQLPPKQPKIDRMMVNPQEF